MLMAAAARPGRPPIPWWGTLLYPATLVALFLGCQGLAGLVGIGEGQRASLAAIPAVLALVVSLPQRLKRQWGEADPWRSLGVVGPWPAALQALLRGLLEQASDETPAAHAGGRASAAAGVLRARGRGSAGDGTGCVTTCGATIRAKGAARLLVDTGGPPKVVGTLSPALSLPLHP